MQPRFKWGQTKELIFLSVMVRDLDRDTVTLSLPSAGDFSFRAKTTKGEEFALDLPLREDVKDSLKFEIAARPDKWGTAVVCTLRKMHEHRWDILVTDPKKFKTIMEKDWSREDQTLEPEEEQPYGEDAVNVFWMNSKNFNKTIAKHSVVVTNVRYPWCTQCKSNDENFLKAAKIAKQRGRSKKDARWKNMGFAIVDAREERKLSRWLDAKCSYTCEYSIFTGPGEEPVKINSKWSVDELLGDLSKYLLPAVHELDKADQVEPLKAKNTTCLGAFESRESSQFAKFKRVANVMRGSLVFAAMFGQQGATELWPKGQDFSFKYDGSWEDNGTYFLDWVRPRSIPLLQPYDWQLRETYEKLGVPIAKLWFDDSDSNPSLEKVVRHAIRRVAKKFIGKIAFVEQKKTSHSYELRDFGLNQPEVYPCFGIASNNSYNAIKYGFEVTTDIAPTAQDFWKDADKAITKLTDFAEQVLAGSWPQAHESGPPHTNWTPGQVKRVVWKTYADIQKPATPVLLEVFGRYRANHELKVTEANNLASTFAEFGFELLVASFDTSENYLPPQDIKREKYSSDTEWYWVPKVDGGVRPPMRKLTKPKKDAPIKAVVEFLKKQSGYEINVDAVIERFEALMKENPPPTTTAPPSMGDMGGLGGLGGMGGMGDMPDLSSLQGAGLGGMPDLSNLAASGGGEL